MRILVTGGAGFIGAHTCRALIARPEVERVTVLDDLSGAGLTHLEGLSIEFEPGSILDPDLLAGLVADATTVIHLAARPSVPRSLRSPLESHAINATGTLHVLEACRKAGTHVIVASSSSVYGNATRAREDLPARPISPYGASKLAAEAYTLAYAESFGVPALVVRLFNVYGPMQPADHSYAAVVPRFVSAALRGRPVPIYGDGRQSRDFTYVGTVAGVLADAAVGRITCPAPMNLAFGTPVDLLHLKDVLAGVLGRPVEAAHLPPRVGDIRQSRAAPDLLATLFPGVRPVPLEEGLRRTVTWFRAEARPASPDARRT